MKNLNLNCKSKKILVFCILDIFCGINYSKEISLFFCDFSMLESLSDDKKIYNFFKGYKWSICLVLCKWQYGKRFRLFLQSVYLDIKIYLYWRFHYSTNMGINQTVTWFGTRCHYVTISFRINSRVFLFTFFRSVIN